jgi:hypothetical protein
MTWFLIALVLGGCTPARRLEIRENRQRAALGEATQAYWSALRWADAAGAGAYLQSPDDRIKLAKELAEPKAKISDVSVVAVEVAEDPAVPHQRHGYHGTSVVRVDVWDVARGTAGAVTVEQHWVNADGAWRVDVAKSPLGSETPW